MDDPKQQLIERLNQAQNILVAVSANPSVDQLSAAIGLTLVLNHLGKHGTAVFSGEVPSTLEFLKPEETLEKNTDSLRDFIIALDKSKADKLRYKVEDQVVRIFITPYKTSISQKDLEFSQGDFNVDVVVALGVRAQQDLDSAITAHGRILHDATVASIGTEAGSNLGSINWVDTTASSLSELIVGLADSLDKKIIDSQIATALLTGIVASTERFRNDKTTPRAMSASAELMAAGANQQLIATELETVPEEPEAVAVDVSEPDESDEPANTDVEDHEDIAEKKPQKKAEPGTLEIEHDPEEEAEDQEPPKAPESESPPEEPELPAPKPPQVKVDGQGKFTTISEESPEPEMPPVQDVPPAPQLTDTDKSEVTHERLTDPPRQSGHLTANTTPESLDPPTEELTLPPLETPMLSHNEPVLPPSVPKPAASLQPAPANWQAPEQISPAETLTEIEQAVGSPHAHPEQAPAPNTEPSASVDDARTAVESAYNHLGAPTDPLAPIAALNAQPLGDSLHDTPPVSAQPVTNSGFNEPTPGNSPADQTLDMPIPRSPFDGGAAAQNTFGAQVPTSPFPQSPTPPSPSAFPAAPLPGSGTDPNMPPPPPVAPPMIPRRP